MGHMIKSPDSNPAHEMPIRASTTQTSQSSGDGVFLKGFKDMKRMSRASKNSTPTKYLNATVKNFKSLVHRHTACRPTPFSMFGGSGKLRGPINLSFDQGLGCNYHQEQAELLPAYTQVILNNAGVTAQINATQSVGLSWSSSSTCGVDDQYNKSAAYAVVESTAASSDYFDPNNMPSGAASLEEITGHGQESADDGSDWFDFVAEFFSADGIL